MENVRAYILSLICVVMAVGVLTSVLDKNSVHYRTVRMIGGILITVTLLSPILRLKIPNPGDLIGKLEISADKAVSQGTDLANNQMSSIIKERSEAYILDKASDLNAQIRVQVELTDSSPPMPDKVYVSGHISPYDKSQMQQYIADGLGIPKEQQIWQ